MFRCAVLMLICLGSPGAALAASGGRAGTGQVCLYESKAYSEGAYICVQKSLMQVCSSDGTRATWKAVSDQGVNDRCTAPMTLHLPAEHRTHGLRRRAAAHRVDPVAERSAKCFMFNGRQYCE
jgi:hypothetical protein